MGTISVFLISIFNQLEFEDLSDSLLNILLKFLVVVLIFFSGLLIGRKTKRLGKDKKFLSGKESDRKKEKHNQLTTQVTYLKNLNKALINENTELRKEISQLQEKKINQDTSKIEFNTPKSLYQKNKTPENPVEIEDKSPKPQTISLFFKYPDCDGSFKMSYGTSISDGDSYFEIVYKENLLEGELKFIADRSSYGKILTIRDTSLMPVSEIENLGDINKPSNITVIENGVVEKKEDRFIIKEGHKLKIKIS